ncbi:MFS transporter [Paracoccus suum]|uniref:Bcr/CflA family efflux transporter n=1 Tax=Paracoccus suum TaxID=2259340 RepID=A0A344PIB5_9RHOB|nr:multidrug effflux MFS transporter [Paracoccus suum]AXC49120.1 MFS transporter [Paracoccus suum]
MTGADAPETRKPRLGTLIALTGLAALSMNLFLPSLPAMARDFGVEYAVIQLSVSAYLAAGAVVQLLAGPLSDRLGRRPVMLGALAVFLMASLACLMAPSIGLFLLARMVQSAVTSGMVLPRAVIRDTEAPDRAAGKIGYLMMGMSVVPMAAPALGGLIDHSFGWRANFVLLVVAGLIVTAWAWHDMAETAPPHRTSWRDQAAGYPRLMRSGRYWGYVLAATFASGTFFAYLGGAAFVGLEVFHMSSAEVGWWFMAPSIGYLAGNFAAGRWSARVGIDRMIAIGAFVTLASLSFALVMTLAGHGSAVVFFGSVAVTSLGNGVLLPNANAGMMTVDPDLAGTAAGLGSALMVAGGAALAAIAGVLLVPGATSVPLVALMATSAAASLGALALIRRG